MKTNTHFWSYLSQVFLEWEIFHTKSVWKIKTHFIFYIIFFPENHVAYEIMWKNMVEANRPQMIIRRMHFACWITKATNTHSEYIILIAFHLQQWLRGICCNVTFYVQWPSCYGYFFNIVLISYALQVNGIHKNISIFLQKHMFAWSWW